MIKDNELSYEKMLESEKNGDVCLKCGSRVSVAWGGKYGYTGYILRCSQNIEHTGVVRLHIPDAYEIIDRKEREAMEQGSKSAVGFPRVTSLSKSRAREIIDTLWPKAPEIEKVKAIMICMDYGLNPLLKHLFIVDFENRRTRQVDYVIMLGIKAKRLIAYRARPGENFAYAEGTPRLMTKDEENIYFGEADDKFISAITIIVDSKGNKYPGYGRFPKDPEQKPKGVEKGNSVANMAIIRSESQALERYAPGAMPDNVEVIDAEFIELPSSSKNLSSTQGNKEAEQKDTTSNTTEASTTTTARNLDMPWFHETLQKIKWNDETTKSWIGITFKINNTGTLEEVLSRLDKEQLERFSNKIQDTASQLPFE